MSQDGELFNLLLKWASRHLVKLSLVDCIDISYLCLLFSVLDGLGFYQINMLGLLSQEYDFVTVQFSAPKQKTRLVFYLLFIKLVYKVSRSTFFESHMHVYWGGGWPPFFFFSLCLIRLNRFMEYLFELLQGHIRCQVLQGQQWANLAEKHFLFEHRALHTSCRQLRQPNFSLQPIFRHKNAKVSIRLFIAVYDA